MKRFRKYDWLNAIGDDTEHVGALESHVAHVMSVHMYTGCSCRLTIAFVAERCRVSPRSIQRAIRKLEHAGYLTVTSGHRANVYTAVIP